MTGRARWDTRTTPAIVLGGRYSALGVIRSLGGAGVPVFVVAGLGDFPVWSRWGRRLKLAAAEGSGPMELAAALESLPLERAVLFPSSDLWAEDVNRLTGTVLAPRWPACLSANASRRTRPRCPSS